MRPETLGALVDVSRACALIEAAVRGVSVEQFLGNWEKQSAVERQLMIVGAAVFRSRALEPAAFEKIPDGLAIISLRNLLAHGYDAVDAATIYRLATEQIAPLREAVEAMLPQG
jgi:uncharacterized protein with HEPN domain